MSRIITLTLNPALDLSTSVEKIVPFSKLRCGAAQRDPGGGGINVARVIQRLRHADHQDDRVLALYPAGGETGHLLQRLLSEQHVSCDVIPIFNETREDFTVYETQSGEQFRFVFPGAALLESEWLACLERLDHHSQRGDWVVASGSLPPQAPSDAYAQIARRVKARGGKISVDSASSALQPALQEGLFLIKPNLREFCGLIGETLSDKTALAHAAHRLILARQVEIIALSLGHDGALIIDQNGAWHGHSPPIRPRSDVGAGDSFLGAFLHHLTVGCSPQEALPWAVAAGSAALLHPGTDLCQPDDVMRLYPDVACRQIVQF